MNSRKIVRALAFVGAVTLGASANVAAQQPWTEVRQTLYEDCERFTGHANGICMRAAAQKMQILTQESRALYKDCLDEGHSRSVCDEWREVYWRNKIVF